MQQTCNEAYWGPHVQDIKEKAGAPCGRTFDDAEQSTLCPHQDLPPSPLVVRA